VMNQLLTEMDGVTAQKLVFFIGATNRPDILDPALMRPGRLDSLIYIGLSDFEARIGIIKACLRKSPVDPEVDYEYLADRMEGFSGADIAGVCKSAAKMCVRAAIANERRVWEAKEAKKKAAADEGKDYESDGEEVAVEDVPFITKKMFGNALEHTRRSVSKADLEKYMRYKVEMERRLGMDDEGGGAAPTRVVGLDAERRDGAPGGAGAAPAGARSFADEPAAAEDDDDIYG